MIGFALQACRSHGKEETAIINHCILSRNATYKLCRKPEECPEGYIPCGTVEWCDQFLPKEKRIPDYYPEFLKDHLHRKVWRADTWPLGQKVFIKPSNFHKRFTGFVTSGGYRKKKKGPFWCSDIVSFTNEWRYYVAEGKVIVAEWYQGDEISEPDPPELNIKLPSDYCGALDFGILTSGEFALVEANSPYACGWYGKKHALYAEWLIKGWEYLTRK
jgi:hypothetical protein